MTEHNTSDRSSDSEQNTVVHLFADYGAESEALSAYGEVHRYTLDPKPNPFVTHTTEVDLTADTPSIEADLVLAHPPCTRWSDMPGARGEDHPNLIPRARELCRALGKDYIIENKPKAPLRDATVLNGRMFGLPLAYERAFETSFRVRTPPMERALTEPTVTPYYYADRSKTWWHGVKGLRGRYPKEHAAKNALPLAYVDHLCRSWLEARNDRDGEVPQNNNSPAPRTVTTDQVTLGGVER